MLSVEIQNILLERGFNKLTTSRAKKSYLRHGIVVGFFLRVCPINNNITAPNLNTAGFQSAFGKTSRFVGFIFQEAKSTENNKT